LAAALAFGVQLNYYVTVRRVVLILVYMADPTNLHRWSLVGE
jgi:hypothetical protein